MPPLKHRAQMRCRLPLGPISQDAVNPICVITCLWGNHHRHFMGEVEAIKFTTYAALVERFIGEVQELWRLEDEEK
jgi:hypothetical protein